MCRKFDVQRRPSAFLPPCCFFLQVLVGHSVLPAWFSCVHACVHAALSVLITTPSLPLSSSFCVCFLCRAHLYLPFCTSFFLPFCTSSFSFLFPFPPTASPGSPRRALFFPFPRQPLHIPTHPHVAPHRERAHTGTFLLNVFR